jgi:zinc protease
MLARILAAVALSTLAAACAEPPPPAPPVQPSAPPPALSAAPPTDPAPVTEGNITVAYANGIKILVKRIPGAEMASLDLYIRGGARDWGAADAGIERLALATATQGGTESQPKDAFARRLASLGSEIDAATRIDYASIDAKSLGAKWDDTFALLADTFLHPALPAEELEVQRERQLTSLRNEQDNPDALLGLRVHDVVYKGHPFENRAIGTIDNVKRFNLDQVKAHLAKLRETSRLLFVTVGDVDPVHVVQKVAAAFGGLPRGNYVDTPFPPVSFAKPSLTMSQKPLETNYIEGSFPAPRWRDADHADGMVAMSVLRFRLFEEVRTKRNLSYAPSAGLGGNSVPLGYLYVSAVDPNTTLKVMFDEVRKLKDAPISDKELAGTKATFLTSYLMESEATDGQAAMLAEAELLGGDFRLSIGLPDRIRAVTSAGVQAFAKKYLARFQMVVVGDPTKIDKALFESM